MKRTVVMLVLAVSVGIMVGVVGTQVLSAQQAAVKRTPLLKGELMGVTGKEVTMFMAEIPPGARTGKHYHPGDEFIFVLEGAGVLEEQGKPPITMKPGTALHYASPAEKAAYVHEAKNTSDTAPLKILAVLITEKGQPLAHEME
ncbi:MAG TPA: cupin domain-containing protein [Candidatus Tectomicrobia bacterium]